jgi:RNA polymerase sigma-70 factor (ECF subfamily)
MHPQINTILPGRHSAFGGFGGFGEGTGRIPAVSDMAAIFAGNRRRATLNVWLANPMSPGQRRPDYGPIDTRRNRFYASQATLVQPATNENRDAVSNPLDEKRTDEAKAAAEEDARLVASVLAGNDADYDKLVRRYQRRAVAVAYRLLGNLHDAADVSQDAFLRGYNGLSKLSDPLRFGPWVMRIVSNLALNFRRSRHSGVRGSTVVLEDVTETPGGFRLTTGEAISEQDPASQDNPGSEVQNAVGQAIERLPEKQRMALILYCIEGLPQKEVAEILECSVELVKWNVFQARKALREELGDLI